jgi:hypothetical protein
MVTSAAIPEGYMTWLQFGLMFLFFGGFLASMGSELSRIADLLQEIKLALQDDETDESF